MAQALRKLIQAKGKVLTLNFQKLFQEMKESSDVVRSVFVVFLILHFTPRLHCLLLLSSSLHFLTSVFAGFLLLFPL